MTATSTREALRNTAAANGWEINETHDLGDSFTRDGEKLAVRFSARGGIVVAARQAKGERYLTEIVGTGKAAAVSAFLTAPKETPVSETPAPDALAARKARRAAQAADRPAFVPTFGREDRPEIADDRATARRRPAQAEEPASVVALTANEARESAAFDAAEGITPADKYEAAVAVVSRLRAEGASEHEQAAARKKAREIAMHVEITEAPLSVSSVELLAAVATARTPMIVTERAEGVFRVRPRYEASGDQAVRLLNNIRNLALQLGYDASVARETIAPHDYLVTIIDTPSLTD